MNEHDNLTPAEMESYRSALKEAYPAPKTDIHANVMKQIRAERMAQKMRRRRAAFVKWGSVAACLLLVCIIAIRVAPDFDKLAPVAEKSDAMAEDISVARYDNRDSDDAVPHEEVQDMSNEYSHSSNSESNGATTPSHDPLYGYTVDLPKDDGRTPADMTGQTGGKTPTDDFAAENEAADTPNAEGVMTEAPQMDAPETEAETDETKEVEETVAVWQEHVTLEVPETEAVATEDPTTLAPETEAETEETEEAEETK